MTSAPPEDPACGGGRLAGFSPAFLMRPELRAMLAALGWEVTAGLPRGAAIGVWGMRRASRAGRAVARLTGRRLVTVEDGFLRSIRPGRQGGPFVSLALDDRGSHADATRASRLELLVAGGAGDAPDLRARARSGIARLRELGLSKVTPLARGAVPLPEPGYVLVVDQVRGDASIAGGLASGESFRTMLATARRENPGARIVVKAHPGATGRGGHLGPGDLLPGEMLLTEPANPWDVVERAARVYAVTSQLGYEALLAGREVHLFGMPFYGGWGLTADRLALPRRRARPSAEALFAATHLLYPAWWDPWHARPASFEEAVEGLALRAEAEQTDTTAPGIVAAGISRWKRPALARFGPPHRLPPKFVATPEAALAAAHREGRRAVVWASRCPPGLPARAAAAGVGLTLVEDGFLRSNGLGAALTRAASLVFDAEGIHFDPARPSALERLIAEATGFPPGDPRLARAALLRQSIAARGVTKYNLGGAAPPRPPAGRRVLLVAGQVAGDASLRLGAGRITDDAALAATARASDPGAFIVYKPHPDVEAGLRRGTDRAAVLASVDAVAEGASVPDLLDLADEVWAMTSLIGFEALLRGRSVTVTGAPFYAGWGLTRDLGTPPARRTARPSLDALVWAALVAYPRYLDPLTGLAATPELIVERLAGMRPATGWSARRAALAGIAALRRR